MSKRIQEKGTIQSVRRAMQLLQLFTPLRTSTLQHRTQWSISDLARASGLHKSVVARLMATMALEGFVVQDGVTKLYSIGPQAFAVGNAYEPHGVLNRIARPVMEELSSRCGHASSLGVPSGNRYVFLVAVESTRSVRVSIAVGESRTLHSGSIGKALLAGMSDDRIRELVGPDPLPKMTPSTIDSFDRLIAEVETVRQTGIAYSREESHVGVGSVGVAINDSSDDSIAALAVVFPIHFVSESDTAELVVLVKEAAERISRQLGAAENTAILRARGNPAAGEK